MQLEVGVEPRRSAHAQSACFVDCHVSWCVSLDVVRL
jgi:hypothetical protein